MDNLVRYWNSSPTQAKLHLHVAMIFLIPLASWNAVLSAKSLC